MNCLRSEKIFQKCFQNGPWKPPRLPKNPPRASQDAPRWSQNASKRFQNPSKMPQVPPKMPPRPLQDAQNSPRAPKKPPSRSTTQILEILGRFGRSFPIFELWLFAENVKSSLNPSLNPKFQSQHVNRLSSTDVLHG